MEKQLLMEGVKTDLMEAAQRFVEIKNNIAELKIDLNQQQEKILIEMKKEGRDTLVVTVGGENYFFEVKHNEDQLRCIKQTKSPVIKEEEL